jgi:EAL domain-containing protein (putative c-di-GMP-specific phosphodiesterase class I)/AmiR/NasT family two-component response regulator
MKILLLDDDVFALKMLAAHLRTLPLDRRGYGEVVSCDDGRAAVAMLEEQHRDFGLILCDLQMPEMDGVEVVRQLVRMGYAGGLVLVTGEDRRVRQAAERLARSHKLNILGSLQKPLGPGELESLLDSVTATRGHERPEDRAYAPVEIEQAIRGGELVNFYQPKVDMRTGRVAGLESLVRWQHPADGLVMPDRFVPVAEKYGLIGELTNAVLRQAIGQVACWLRAGLRLNVAVNVSMTDLNEVDFPDALAALAGEFDVPLSNISLEVTEGQLMTEPRSQLDVLTRLRLKRVRLSIDDFGMGYSCMAQLRDLPFDELKVDRSFVDGASRDPSLKAILDASLGLARELGMTSVGEGIETEADWHCLRDARCDLAQGYFIARPMPAELLERWMDDWANRYAKLSQRRAPMCTDS